MELEQIINSRISVIEGRLASLESRLSEIEQAKVTRRKKRDLTPEERAAIRTRLVAGQQKKQQEREAQIMSEATTQTKKPRNAKKEESAREG